MVEKILMALIAGLFGLLPIIIQMLNERSRRRSATFRLDRLIKEIEFLEAYGRVTESYGEAQNPGLMSADLLSVREEYKQIRFDLEKSTAKSSISWWQRLFLLFRPLSTKGWVVHTAFYFLVIFCAAMMVGDLLHPTQNLQTGESEFIYLVIGISILFGPLFFWLQKTAIGIRKKDLSAA
ncbi:hypothetical protein [Teredinibacter sp. KSP-S5-2]|uniref:hypothetical protein n=1 Tax=Teredinibacter sp. KSP-S5-2 TaxID=3034506 RepID=UPI002934F16A|nr:hypothetical protein [Teredinibacter sp. KSP-S5-2]WNO08128.1 hypothetical protein P5V12_14210 [Teredinibacter sp. KSP-S5-2]